MLGSLAELSTIEEHNNVSLVPLDIVIGLFSTSDVPLKLLTAISSGSV